MREVPIEERRQTIGSLKGVQPLAPDLSEYIADLTAAQQLGKAFFWDVQVGSTGTACASCHFHSGADIRVRNQVNPGLKAGDNTFAARASGEASGPNKTYSAADFPFHKLSDAGNRESNAVADGNDVFSSQGSLGGDFISANRATDGRVNRGHERRRGKGVTASETCTLTYDPANNPFHANGLMYRKVEPRQTPSAINAVFNHRQFWDGRANSQFNGVDPFGPRTFQVPANPGDPGNPDGRKAGTLVAAPKLSSHGGVPLRLEQRLIDNSSLASQAVGPPLSDFEMSCAKKTFADLGRKLLPLRPLALQKVHSEDSLFGASPALLSKGKGLDTTYRRLIERAFRPKFWSEKHTVRVNADGTVVEDASGFTQMEHNFSLFWGLAIQAYESLLVSDDSPFDRAKNGDLNAMSDEARAGEVVFTGKGGCIGCHFGPLMSAATTYKKDSDPKVIERMRMGSGGIAFYDAGYYNIGVRPTKEDLGVGATDPYGFDLSFARQYKWQLTGQGTKSRDSFDPTPCRWLYQYWPCADVPTTSVPMWTDRDTVDGSFKTPILRNVGLSPPYFHNGGTATLADVVRFYNRGGDRRGDLLKDTSGLETPNGFGQVNDTNLDADIGNASPELNNTYNALGLTPTEQRYLVQFLLSLTDERVACHSGNFDHPELPLVMGQEDVAVKGTQTAKDIMRSLPAVGRRGLAQIGKPCFPNSGDLFGSINVNEPAGLQATFRKILDGSDANDGLAFGRDAIAAPAAATATGSGATAGSAGGAVASSGSTTAAGVTGRLGAILNSVASAISSIQQRVLGGSAATAATIATPAASNATAPGNAAGAKPAAAGQGAGQGGVQGGVAGATGGTTTTATTTSTQVSLFVQPPTVPAPVFTAAAGDIQAFETIGFLQSATVGNQGCPNISNARQWGGSAVVNGIKIVVPCNTILQMPAATFTWAELFPASSGGIGSDATPLALDAAAAGSTSGFAFPSTEIRVVGNIVAGKYIAGLIFISQQSLNTGSGVIVGFDYDKGFILLANKTPNAPPIKLQINDAKSRFSRGISPDSRFNVDDANPTIRATSGYPMCVPRVDPALGDDARCPKRNRPRADAPEGCRNFRAAGIAFPTGRDLLPPQPGQLYCSAFVMGDPNTARADQPSSRYLAPFVVGDFLTYSGTLLRGTRTSATDSDIITVHTINAKVGIFTEPGTLPVYMAIDEFRIAAVAPIDFINGVLQEEQDRLVLEAVVTDVTSIVDVYLVDIDPATGKETQRWVTPDTMTSGVGGPASNGRLITGGITTQFTGPVPGRVRIRANRAVPGLLNSPTRYIRVASRSLCDPANINGTAPLLGSNPPVMVPCLERAPAANGLLSGQYMAPTFDYIFPETIVPGDPQPANNFWDLGFLVNGEGPGTGRLQPTPW